MRRLSVLLLALLLPLTLLAGCTKPAPERTADGGILGGNADYDYVRYEQDAHVRLTKYKGKAVDVTLPSRIEGAPVTELGSYAFSWTAVQTVHIPDGVTAIGAAAFEMCAALTAVTLPATLRTLGDGAFVSCPALAELRLDAPADASADAAFRVQSGVLYADFGRTLLLYPGGLTAEAFDVPPGVTRIARRAFEGQAYLREIALPEGLSHIEDAAFAQCTALAHVALPDTLVSLGIGAFSYSGLTALYLPDSLTALPDQLCWGCDTLTVLRLPATLTAIGDSAFRECTLLLDVALPDTLTIIGSVAFYACEMLERVEIPPLVTALPQQAFAQCTSLTDIVIPATVTSIHEAALDGDDADALRIHGAPGSEAERFAGAAEFAFVAE